MPCQWPEMFHKLCRHLPELAIHQAYQDGTEKTKQKKVKIIYYLSRIDTVES